MSRKRSHPPRALPWAVLFAAAVLMAGAAWVWRTRPELAARTPWARRDARRGLGPASAPTGPRPQRSLTALVYFLRITDRGVELIPTKRQVPAESPARAALEELIAGPLPEGCISPLPDGTRLRGVKVKDGLATADFSEELVKRFPGGSSNEAATVYSIVNTLTSLPGVEKVQILVGGRVVDSIGGHVDVSSPLSYDGELVKH